MAVIAYVLIAPLPLEPEPDLSFRVTTHDAFARRLQNGSDIVSTYGPWGVLQRGFDRRTDAAVLLASTLLALAFTCGAIGVAQWGAPVIALIVAMGGHDARFTALAILLIFSSLLPPSPFRELPLIAILGIIALIKFPLLVISAFAVLVVTVARRSVVPPLVFAASFVIAWIAAGQHIGGIPTFLLRQVEVGSGYAGASAAGSAIGAIAAAALLLLIAFAERRAFPIVAIGGAIAYVAKVGYVRADPEHSGAANALLLLIGFVYVLVRGEKRLIAVAAAAVALIFGAPPLLDRLRNDVTWLRDRPAHIARYEAEMLAVTDDGLPPVRGTIDSFPAGSAELVAHGLRYTPRPVFQSNMVWTAALGRLNAEFLRGDSAPQFLWVTVGSVDNKLPLLDDAPSWLEMLRRYDVAARIGDHLLLRKRAAPRAMQLVPLQTLTVRPDEEIAVPDGVIWCEIEAHPSVARRLLEVVTRPSPATLNGWRISPAMTRGGFLLSPQVGNVDDLVRLFAGNTRAALRLRLHGASLGDRITVRLSAVKMPGRA